MKGHKRQKPGRAEDAWELIVDIGRDPVTNRRKQQSRAFRGTSREADTALAAFVTEVGNTRTTPTDAPLIDLINGWLDLVEDDLSPTTLANYRSTVRVHIGPALGSRSVGAITTRELDDFYRSKLEDRKPATVRQMHSVIRRALRQGVRWGWIAYNPAADATPPTLKRTPMHIPTPRQLGALLEAAAKPDPALALILRLAAVTGARRGEVLGIHESRVDLIGGSILIDRNVVQVGNATFEKDPKTHQSRKVSIDARTTAAIKAHLLECRKQAMAGGISRALDPYVFSPTADGSLPITPSTITAAFIRLAKIHAPGVRLHDLRHFAATQLLASGVPVKTVSARLGHGSSAMTLDVYAHALPAADQGAGDFLGGLLDED